MEQLMPGIGMMFQRSINDALRREQVHKEFVQTSFVTTDLEARILARDQLAMTAQVVNLTATVNELRDNLSAQTDFAVDAAQQVRDEFAAYPQPHGRYSCTPFSVSFANCADQRDVLCLSRRDRRSSNGAIFPERSVTQPEDKDWMIDAFHGMDNKMDLTNFSMDFASSNIWQIMVFGETAGVTQ